MWNNRKLQNSYWAGLVVTLILVSQTGLGSWKVLRDELAHYRISWDLLPAFSFNTHDGLSSDCACFPLLSETQTREGNLRKRSISTKTSERKASGNGSPFKIRAIVVAVVAWKQSYDWRVAIFPALPQTKAMSNTFLAWYHWGATEHSFQLPPACSTSSAVSVTLWQPHFY